MARSQKMHFYLLVETVIEMNRTKYIGLYVYVKTALIIFVVVLLTGFFCVRHPSLKLNLELPENGSARNVFKPCLFPHWDSDAVS